MKQLKAWLDQKIDDYLDRHEHPPWWITDCILGITVLLLLINFLRT